MIGRWHRHQSCIGPIFCESETCGKTVHVDCWSNHAADLCCWGQRPSAPCTKGGFHNTLRRMADFAQAEDQLEDNSHRLQQGAVMPPPLQRQQTSTGRLRGAPELGACRCAAGSWGRC